MTDPQFQEVFDRSAEAWVQQIMVRLADEEIPVGAIARATKRPADEVRDILHDAVARGAIIRIPRPDWHPLPRGERTVLSAVEKLSDDTILHVCIRLFKITRLQASLFTLLIKRNEVTKEMMHHAIEQRRVKTAKACEETDPKMVDVVVCHLRKRLKAIPLEIKTLWGCGYYMSPVDRRTANEMINAFVMGESDGPQTETAPGNSTGPFEKRQGDPTTYSAD